jgi:deoxyribose-phosphate aldolase
VTTTLTPTELARHIQHTLIRSDATESRIRSHLQECLEYGFDAAMVAGPWVPLAAEMLRGSRCEVASALDFPIVGLMTSRGKAAEAAELVRLGATQLDVGVQIGWLKSGDFAAFRDDIAGVVACGVPVKVMLELPLLTAPEREAAVALSIEAGAAYLKNASSGAVETASVESIKFLADRVPAGVLVKASGSITSYEQTVRLLGAGAALVGTSAGVSIVTGGRAGSSY